MHAPTEPTDCRRCSTCADAPHHWMEDSFDPDGPDLDPIEQEIVADWRAWEAEDPDNAPSAPVYWVCKHCDHWERWIEECEECGGPADADERCLYHPEHHGD